MNERDQNFYNFPFTKTRLASNYNYTYTNNIPSSLKFSLPLTLHTTLGYLYGIMGMLKKGLKY